MANWTKVLKSDDMRLLSVLDQVHALAVSTGYDAAKHIDPAYATACILNGFVDAVWIEDHTILVYSVSEGTWHSPDIRCLNELLLFKYKKTPGATFQSVASTLDDLAKEFNCDIIGVGNSLSPQPERLMLLYERVGYKPHANILIKECK